MADRVYPGILKGIEEIVGIRFAVVTRPRTGFPDLLIAPGQFPSEDWIRDHVGGFVHLIMDGDKVVEVKEGVDPSSVMKVEIAGSLVAVTCTFCGEIVCHAPPPHEVSPEQAKESLRPVVKHIAEKHPDEFEKINRTI